MLWITMCLTLQDYTHYEGLGIHMVEANEGGVYGGLLKERLMREGGEEGRKRERRDGYCIRIGLTWGEVVGGSLGRIGRMDWLFL
jgi:hypothetical protein